MLACLVPSKGDANGISDHPRVVFTLDRGALAGEAYDQGEAPAVVGLVEPVALVDLPAPGQPLPPTRELVLAYARATWPEAPDVAERVVGCEINGYPAPAVVAVVFDLEREHGGPMQISRSTWAAYFAERYGWTWGAIVTDLATHFAAAREIYDRAGGWSPWGCY